MVGENTDVPLDSPPEVGPSTVHIYGAGVAGLTAAHELARRGFQVRVYEPAQEYDETGCPEGAHVRTYLDYSLAVGGMARSQFLRIAKGARGNFPQQGQHTTSEKYRLLYDYTQDWKDGGLGRRGILTRFLYGPLFSPSHHAKPPGIIQLRYPLFPFDDPERFPSLERVASAVRDVLTGATPVPDLPPVPTSLVITVDDNEERFAREVGDPFPPLEDRNEPLLQLEVVHYLPGEHGFRFFPSYYRHLFSTMMETPLLDADGNVTGRWVYDNLVPSSFYGIAARGRRIRFLRRAPPSRPVELLQDLQDLFSSGYPPSDSLQFSLRLWRYMCTCSERRQAEYERISWWEYLEGFDPTSETRRYRYSDAFKKDMQFAPRVLAAFDGAWGDARTNGNTLTQLYLNNLLPMPKTDGTLNGPTTPAWFRPWRRYLEEYLGVEFIHGRLARLVLDPATRRLTPWVVATRTGLMEVEDVGADYCIVATDAETAERLTSNLDPIGVIQGLRRFTTWIPPNPRGPQGPQERRAGVLPGHVPWDRFQTLTGIQFFFPSSVRLAEGYLYFMDAPWGLSAINSQQYWATPPTLNQDGFGAVLSVDIGNWYVREPELRSPSNSSRHEIAHEVWRQLRQATEQHQDPWSQARQPAFTLPEPSWYHVDRFIRFEKDEATGRERPVENRAPYLIPIMGDWEHRPGPEPWDPMAPTAAAGPREPLPEGLWQAPHGGYCVHWGKLVFAGTYLKTFTRMTTMESANESARHAVNAIIDHYLAHRPLPDKAPRGAAASAVAGGPDYGGGNSLTGSPEFLMTPLGEYCRIWDPEKHELPELAALRALDAKLFAQGLPHVWDVLNLEPLALPLVSPLSPRRGAEVLKSFLDRVRAALETRP
jgi:hypothetical protein